MLRNQVDCRVLLYDVWDNRSFRMFRAYARQLTDPAVRARLGLDNPAGVELMERAARSRTAEEAYALLGFEYLLDPSGTLSGVPEGGFDLVVSSDVGEHILRASLPLVVGGASGRCGPAAGRTTRSSSPTIWPSTIGRFTRRST